MNFSKKLITLFTLVTICLSVFTVANAEPELLADYFGDYFKYEEKGDIVYAANPNGVKVFDNIDSESEIATIPYLWGIDRIATIRDNWCLISYNEEKKYVRTSEIMLADEKDFDIREQNYDTVISGDDSTNVYARPIEADEYWVGNIPAHWGIDRIMTLDNGWTVISYNDEYYFAKTNTLKQRVYIGDYLITYYCPCSICNGPWGPYDRFGNPLVNGSAAVDPNVFNFGDVFEVEESYGMRTCVARDVGGAIKGSHIDVFVDVDHYTCENMGCSRKPVYMYKTCE